ncbi:MAG: preprotein translocase subunit YajC [Desulfobulbus sp.]|nr:MAG: preprotein translocase subunit YajC [Desulfobulbus sp.]RUM38691.1 MAG: preprotein translocase subunit YajC [Desulfobulbus sp.]RUM39548.1 MAG: preprotein translocase subunit YajC [Desulfobulbus sp.]
MTGIAYAAGAAAPAGPAGNIGQFIPLILIFAVFYFLLIRPQQKKAKQHQQFLNDLKKGARVVTGGGIHGRITGITDTVVTLEIAEGVRIKVNRGSILGINSDTEKATAPTRSGG